MSIEMFQKFNFNGKDCRVWEIYEVFKSFCNQRKCFMNFLPTKTDPRENKNWKYFEEVYNKHCKSSVFDPYIFIEAQFRDLPKDKILFPAQLKTKVADVKYEEHRNALKIKESSFISDTEKIMTSLTNTMIFLKDWWKRKRLVKYDYVSFFKKNNGEVISEGMSFCMQGMISKYFMSISEHFNREYNRLDEDMKYEIIEPEELTNYRVKIRLDEYAYKFAKEIFKDEII